jgi:hypothetical protein
METKLDHAILLAHRGFYIFPLSPNSKLPLKDFKWRAESTTREARIKEWWGENPDYNIAIDTGKTGVYVIDVDTKEGKVGKDSYKKLDAEYGFPNTVTFITATGGLHLVYADRGLGNTAGTLAKDIDTRGEGGYIVAPGSEIAGFEYYISDDSPRDPAPLPEWIKEKLAAHKSAKKATNKDKVISADNPADVEKAKRWLLDVAETAVEGHGGDHTTFATAAKLKEFGISPENTLELLLDHWNDRCSPPWQIEDLQRKVDNAYRYAQKAQGAASAQADFEPVITEINNEMVPEYLIPDEHTLEKRKRVIGNIAIKKMVTILTAPPGVGKSTFTIALALSKASGRNILGINPYKQGAVMLQNNEDDFAELGLRTAAAAKHYGISNTTLTEENGHRTLFVQSGEKRPLRIAQRAGANNSIKPLDADALIVGLIANKIELLIVDPFSETHPANENDNGEILKVASIYREVAQKADCAIILVHHDRKPDQANAEGHIGNMNSSRGASSLAGVARIMLTFHTMPPSDAKRYGVAPEERHLYARLDFAKANMSLSSGEPTWFKRVSVRVGGTADDFDSSESVGVLEPAKLKRQKAPLDDRTHSLLADIEALICGSGDQGKPLSQVVVELLGISDYQETAPDTLTRKITRTLADGMELPALKGSISLHKREKKKGDPANMPINYIRWISKHEVAA